MFYKYKASRNGRQYNTSFSLAGIEKRNMKDHWENESEYSGWVGSRYLLIREMWE